MSWRGGREALWRSWTRSGEGTRQTCGLSDDGNAGPIFILSFNDAVQLDLIYIITFALGYKNN